MIGLKRGAVELSDYKSEWKQLYHIEEKIILSKIKKYVVDIQHIGSTAISNIISKPIIDILIGIKDFKELPNIIKILEESGYIYRPEASNNERCFFVRGTENSRTHHIHIVQWNSEEWNNKILFRDYLINHDEVAKEYCNLKKMLAEKYKYDRNNYTDGKSNFIKNVIIKAKKEL